MLVIDKNKLNALEQKREMLTLKKADISSMKLMVKLFESIEVSTLDDKEVLNEDLLCLYKYLYINKEITLDSIPLKYRNLV